jgi:hypothetical protein
MGETMQAQPAPQPGANEEDLLDKGVNEIIAEHGGDARKAKRRRCSDP